MFKHIVLWRVATESEGRDQASLIAEVESRLRALPAQIPEIREFEVGRNVKSSEFAADVALYSAFDDEAAFDRYVVHPAHQEAGGFIGGVVTDRRVVDYLTD